MRTLTRRSPQMSVVRDEKIWRPAMLRYIWASPNTAIGLLLALIVLAARGRARIAGGVLEVHGPLARRALRRCVPVPGGASAITFGHVVIGQDAGCLEVSRAHERVHVRQCEIWGPAFLPAYLLASAWGWLTGRGAYRGNYFEREAVRRADEGGWPHSGRARANASAGSR